MKQTAVDWLYNNLKSHFEHDGDLLEAVQFSFEQAKEMEKQHIIDAYNKVNDTQLFNITNASATANMYISETDLVLGEYSVVIKDTATFPAGDYLVDVEYTSADGFKRSTPTFQIKMVERL